MFKSKMFGRKIVSDQGFEVHIGTEGRGTLFYLEQKKRMTLNSETSLINKSLSIAFWKSSIKKWDPPFDNEILNEDKRNKIIKNVEEALKFAKFDIVQVI